MQISMPTAKSGGGGSDDDGDMAGTQICIHPLPLLTIQPLPSVPMATKFNKSISSYHSQESHDLLHWEGLYRISALYSRGKPAATEGINKCSRH